MAPPENLTISQRVVDHRDGWTLTAYEVIDTDTHPESHDGYTRGDIDAWRRDEWSFSTVVVVASIDGVDLGSASIGAIPAGDYWEGLASERGGIYTEPLADHTGPGSFANGYGTQLCHDAVMDGRRTLARITAKAIGGE